jgi:hypothetical protein
MGIHYKIRTADDILARLSVKDRRRLDGICRQIRKEQECLQRAGRALFERCITGCEGLCCKNVIADELITLRDFIFILAASSVSASDLLPLAEEEPLFTADCMFLKDGVGPCRFPDGVRPEKCVLSFCGDDQPISENIRSVHRGFVRLQRFLLLHKPALLFIA